MLDILTISCFSKSFQAAFLFFYLVVVYYLSRHLSDAYDSMGYAVSLQEIWDMIDQKAQEQLKTTIPLLTMNVYSKPLFFTFHWTIIVY